MGKKKFKGDGIFFTGKAAEEVTGSQYLVRFGDYQCLLECGLHQSKSNSYLDSYKANSEKFQFNPSDIDFLFVAHPHIDHCGLIPRLVKEGFHGRIIATPITASVMKPLLLNSCYIVNEEAKILSKRYKREYKPLYEESDVHATLKMIDTYGEYNHIYQLNDTISFQWLRNSHCIGAAQLQLIFSSKGKTRKILYTSDIGALHTDNHYVVDTEIPTMFNDVVIMESTYGDSKRDSKKTRAFDVEHMKVALYDILERGGTALFPCFSFSRTQEILTTLFEAFGADENFSYPVIVDSRLTCDINKVYSNVLDGNYAATWDKVINWHNVKCISDKIDSQNCLADPQPKIVIASSGFCTNGRIVNYLKKYLQDDNSMVVFSGYTGDNPTYLSYRIKNYRDHKTIGINKEQVPNKSGCITMSTFSSHANHKDLVEYGSSVNTNKIVLVHGSPDGRKCLMDDLADAISKKDKTGRVVSATRGMVLHL